MGPMYLSAVLKREGYEVDVIILNRHSVEERDNLIKEIDPDYVGCYMQSDRWDDFSSVLIDIKKKFPNIKIIMGGPHPTFFKDCLDKNKDWLDVICIGEGEGAIVDLFREPDRFDIPNLWFAVGNVVFKNDKRKLEDPLDNVPMMDRELYYGRYKFLKEMPVKRFITSRGCPYNCSFCYNVNWKLEYGGQANFVRKRSPRDVLNEIKYVKEHKEELEKKEKTERSIWKKKEKK